jgi:hypothetical protein
MSSLTAAPVHQRSSGTPSANPDGVPRAVEFRYTQTESFPALLHQQGASLLVITYQANKLLVVRAAGAGLSTLVRTFDQPMGLAVDARGLTLGTRTHIWTFRNAPDIAARVKPAGQHDACFLPRSGHVTGDIRVHELAWVREELWIVNTRFSCLCTLHPDYSFVPRWRPPFITALAAEDRCHLNGLAIVDNQARFVTALGVTHRPSCPAITPSPPPTPVRTLQRHAQDGQHAVPDRHGHRHCRDHRHPVRHGHPGGGEPAARQRPGQRDRRRPVQPDRHRRGCVRQRRHRLPGHAGL